MRFRFSATSLSERNEELRWRNKEVTIKCLQLLKAVIYNEIVRLPGDWKDNVSLYSGSVPTSTALQLLLYCITVVVY